MSQKITLFIEGIRKIDYIKMDSKERIPYHPDVMKALHVEVPTFGFKVFRMLREDSIRLFNVDQETLYSRIGVIGHFMEAGDKKPTSIKVVELIKKRYYSQACVYHVLLEDNRQVVIWIHNNLKNTMRIFKIMETIEHLQERNKTFEPFEFQVWEVDGAYIAFDES